MPAVILFDGVCNFCNSTINFVIERDRTKFFRFAPLQSAAAAGLMHKYGIDGIEADSVVVVENEKAYLRSAAALHIARHLTWPWKALYLLIVIPRPLRDIAYTLFARNRYRLFGKKDVCMMPTPDLRNRFLT